MKKLLAALALSLLCVTPLYAQPAKPDIVEVLEITGEINQSTAKLAADAVEKINETKNVKAVVMSVNSPGGGVLATAAVYEELSKLKVPVVGWCNYVCASGGIYILMSPSVKYIGVRPEAISGSVGVIMQITRFNRLLEWARIDNETYKSGALKDAGNPTRGAIDDERRYLQGIIDETAGRFYEVVRKARPKITAWPEIRSARIFVGEQAVKIGLADKIMGRDEAISKAKELSGSKMIFTRDELRKMSHAANDGPVMQAPIPQPQALGDVPWLIEALKEIRAGETIKFEYRMPYRF